MTGTIDILGTRHTIVEAPPASIPADQSGDYEEARALITLDAAMSDGTARRILLHEVIHGISEALDLNLTEHQVIGLAAGLNSIPQLALQLGKIQ